MVHIILLVNPVHPTVKAISNSNAIIASKPLIMNKLEKMYT